ncbi:hypothetical protein OG689_44555 [Kitasatospora sp. NBC_00240]|uniref:hypothetical protein n=1 Tax=Kitasatospora sp. NBC_00240 TaxID=2903567 RepID=UPI00225B755B|nr:hypothetical protein [Kitasatospora sp. NBC_00240]MCX5216211.1 hypothetical protein [Kitasatospora sp. NBC_00240]
MEAGTVTVTAYVKATRTVVHDVALTLELSAALASDPNLVRRHIEDLNPGALSAACTDETVDRVTDVALLHVSSIDVVTDGVNRDAD